MLTAIFQLASSAQGGTALAPYLHTFIPQYHRWPQERTPNLPRYLRRYPQPLYSRTATYADHTYARCRQFQLSTAKPYALLADVSVLHPEQSRKSTRHKEHARCRHRHPPRILLALRSPTRIWKTISVVGVGVLPSKACQEQTAMEDECAFGEAVRCRRGRRLLAASLTTEAGYTGGGPHYGPPMMASRSAMPGSATWMARCAFAALVMIAQVTTNRWLLPAVADHNKCDAAVVAPRCDWAQHDPPTHSSRVLSQLVLDAPRFIPVLVQHNGGLSPLLYAPGGCSPSLHAAYAQVLILQTGRNMIRQPNPTPPVCFRNWNLFNSDANNHHTVGAELAYAENDPYMRGCRLRSQSEPPTTLRRPVLYADVDVAPPRPPTGVAVDDDTQNTIIKHVMFVE
ncbi:hypothetical protein BDW22DRAFT_1348614 [Trametopsis cervina]|nr:hypothetical protein BDW22DRAFT_1348614 [Trametopsis cervina]